MLRERQDALGDQHESWVLDGLSDVRAAEAQVASGCRNGLVLVVPQAEEYGHTRGGAGLRGRRHLRDICNGTGDQEMQRTGQRVELPGKLPSQSLDTDCIGQGMLILERPDIGTDQRDGRLYLLIVTATPPMPWHV